MSDPQVDPFAKVLDFARKGTSGNDQEFTGEFQPDPDQVNQFGTADQEDDGKYRYANKSPQELRRLLAAETNPVERDALEWTLLVFQAKKWASDPNDPKATRAGEPYRGEPREAATPASMDALT